MSDNKSNFESRGSAVAPNIVDEPVSNKSAVLKGVLTTIAFLGGLAALGYLLFLFLN